MYLYILIAVVVVLSYLVLVYNGLITLKNRTKEAWSDIDVQLKRRYDLIPNLVKVVQGYAKQEKEVFENVTKARATAISAQGAEEQAKAENVLSSTLKTLFAVAEAYPTLRSSENFKALQDELSDTENKISSARRFYNSNVRDFNTKLEVFPNNILGGALGFKNFELFQLPISQKAEALEPPKVEM